MVSFRNDRRVTPGIPPTPGPPQGPPPSRNPLVSSKTRTALSSWEFSCSSCQWRSSWAEMGMGACGHSLCPPLFIFPASHLFSLSMLLPNFMICRTQMYYEPGNEMDVAFAKVFQEACGELTNAQHGGCVGCGLALVFLFSLPSLPPSFPLLPSFPPFLPSFLPLPIYPHQ